MSEPFPRCQMADPALGDWELPSGEAVIRPCAEPTIAVITFGCLHEHVAVISACMTCAAEIQRCGDELRCRQCEDGEPPHECPQAFKIRWLVIP